MKRRYIHPITGTVAMTTTSEGIAAASKIEYSDTPADPNAEILTHRQNSIWEEDTDE